MINETSLAAILEEESISFERLYKIELERMAPATCASETRMAIRLRRHRPRHAKPKSIWKTVAMFYDVCSRSLDDLVQDVMLLTEGQDGKWRVQVYYWSGSIKKPQKGKYMGQGQDFLYSDNPRGDTIVKLNPPIEFEIGKKKK